jgi:NitT/TauT family transport system permease protein
MSSGSRRILSVVVFLLAWEAIVRGHLVDPFLLAAPSTIAAAIWELARSGELEGHIASSMSRMFAGYFLAVVVGVVLGGLMGWIRWLDDFLDPLIELFRPVSPLALLPLAILWLGIGQTSKIFIIAYGCVFPILLNTYGGVRGVSRSNVEAARTLGAASDEILRRVVFFHSLPLILTGARISFGVGMIVIIASEMVAADRGLGYMILTAQQNFQTSDLYAGIVTIAAIGFVGDRLIRLLRKALCPWYVENEQV